MNKRKKEICNYFYSNLEDIISNKIQFRVNSYDCITFHPGMDDITELHRFWLNDAVEVNQIWNIIYNHYNYFLN